MPPSLRIDVHDTFRAITETEWDGALGPDATPFERHAFLATLEETGSLNAESGWLPRPVVVRNAENTVVGVAPCFEKTHSMGEFVYDHGWADAARRAGIAYYPKLVVGIPFTPVTGDRLLVRPGLTEAAQEATWDALLKGIERAAGNTHGVHVLFPTEKQARHLEQDGLFTRVQYQFHWKNDGYRNFDDWLSTFPSDKRNKIRRERKELKSLTVEVIENPSPDVLDDLHGFYTSTSAHFGPWGHVYLSKATFRALGERLGPALHAVVARDGSQVLGGAFNVRSATRLYGRYWGANEAIRFLHFEVCYYRAIEDCIERGLAVFEPGHGGGHKYRRGFEPTITWSNHSLAHERLNDALKRHCVEEARVVQAQAATLAEAGGHKR